MQEFYYAGLCAVLTFAHILFCTSFSEVLWVLPVA